MAPQLTDDDIGKTVTEPNGSAIGVLTDVEGERVLVEPNPSALDSIKAALGWELEADEPVPVDVDDVAAVTDDAVRLEASASDAPSSDAGDPVVEQEEGDADPRDVGAGTGDGKMDASDRTQVEGEEGANRHEDNEDAPPHGDRTVTTDRGRKDDR
ncbi:hypothetical protein [Halopiger goleimassiliensis]|uniref:hypothetical protein n=1 Tax=Halopiger goleimassiliensis TaxID=1293048 RepID=UPI000678293B|nr:hypothetical protein [Halopiger goleimassiliensis]